MIKTKNGPFCEQKGVHANPFFIFILSFNIVFSKAINKTIVVVFR